MNKGRERFSKGHKHKVSNGGKSVKKPKFNKDTMKYQGKNSDF